MTKHLWNEIKIVFAEEIRRGSRRIWFRISTLLFPLILVVAMVAIPAYRSITADDGDNPDAGRNESGIVDNSGLLNPEVVSGAGLEMFPDRDTGIQTLLDGDIKALFIVPQDYMTTGQVEGLHTDSIIAVEISGDHRALVSNVLRYTLVGDSLTPRVSARFLSPANFESIVVQGDQRVAEDIQEASSLSVSYIFMFLMVISVVTGSMMLLESVSDEKENRMIEIIATSITPVSMMAGKVLAQGSLGLLQISVWAGSLAFIGPRILENFPDARQLTVDPILLVWAVMFFLAGYFLMSVVMAGMGAASTSVQEARGLSWIVLVPSYVPMILWTVIIENPHGPPARLLSFIPITAPPTMMLRMGATDVPAWEIIVSLALVVAGGVALLWASARVLRAGLLMYGQRMSLKNVVTALRGSG
ncbi:MAG: ABC transporter permease [SAR202 cluster bacterium]|nr:ABC transporter permease [SAR202 cluster bacterium]MDP6713601.1 ABC transporter permease [SAR202 cluster bacterium]